MVVIRGMYQCSLAACPILNVGVDVFAPVRVRSRYRAWPGAQRILPTIVMTSDRLSSSQLYSRDGTLVAITSQEGVVRADVRGPQTESGSVGAKL